MPHNDLPGSSRRHLFRTGFKSLGELVLKTAGAYMAGYQETNPAPVPPVRTRIRPPGARAEPEFLAKCTRCDDCIRACPFEALGRDPQGHPWLRDPAGHPCYMCDGFPCIAACAPSALTFFDRRLRTIGMAAIDPATCIASAGQGCTVCRDSCRDVRAIRLVDLLPVVDAASCTGCGVCAGKCPAEPGTIRIEVRPQR